LYNAIGLRGLQKDMAIDAQQLIKKEGSGDLTKKVTFVSVLIQNRLHLSSCSAF
jgi:hypothetical protein